MRKKAVYCLLCCLLSSCATQSGYWRSFIEHLPKTKHRGTPIDLKILGWNFDVSLLSRSELSVYNFAFYLYRMEDLENSILEFKRLASFSNLSAPYALLMCGEIYLSERQFNKAVHIYSKWLDIYKDHDLQDYAVYHLSLAYFLQGEVTRCIDILKGYTFENQFLHKCSLYLMAMCYAYEGEWDLFASTSGQFNDYNDNNDKYFDKININDNLINILKSKPSKNPTIAALYSVIPGGGQMYSNAYSDAITSILFNTGIIWLTYESFNDRFSSGTIFFGSLGLIFYIGNIYNGYNNAKTFNRILDYDVTNKLVESLYQPSVFVYIKPDDVTNKFESAVIKISFN